MGVRTSLLAMNLSASIAFSNSKGTDLAGEIQTLELECQEMIAKMNDLNTRILTPNSDSTNASILTTQISALG